MGTVRSDARLAADCRAELDWDPALDARHLVIGVSHGVVTLGGWVCCWPDGQAALRAVARLRGVRGVVAGMAVRLPETARQPDAAIAERARQLLAWRHRPLAEAVQVVVADGRVTLTGEVDWQAEKLDAERSVGALAGVTEIENAIQVRPRPLADDPRAGIRRALDRRVGLEGSSISITTVGHTVLLTGRVHAYEHRDTAERVAWSAPGVTAVEVHIKVGSDVRPETGA